MRIGLERHPGYGLPLQACNGGRVPSQRGLCRVRGRPDHAKMSGNRNQVKAALVCFQTLDGISASVVGVMMPLVVADITRRGGRLNLGMGILGLAGGLGAMISNAAGGALANRFGQTAAFAALGVVGLTLVALIWRKMPDTKPKISSADTEGTRPPDRGGPRAGGHSPKASLSRRLVSSHGQAAPRRRS